MVIHKTFCDGVGLTGVAQVLYTVPAGLKGTLEKITFCNNDTVARSVLLYLVPTGGAAGYINQIEKAKVLQPGETWSSPNAAGHLLEAGGTIQVTPSANTVIGCRATGYESTT